MSRLHDHPSFVQEMRPTADHVRRENPFVLRDEEQTGEHHPAPARQGISDGMAAALAGVLVMGLGGLIIGAVISGGTGTGFGIGLAAGVAAGLLIGRKIAGFETVVGGALVTGLLPLLLCFKDALRRGRLQLNDLGRPDSLAVMGGIFAAGAVLGGLLVGTRKLIVRMSRREAR